MKAALRVTPSGWCASRVSSCASIGMRVTSRDFSLEPPTKGGLFGDNQVAQWKGKAQLEQERMEENLRFFGFASGSRDSDDGDDDGADLGDEDPDFYDDSEVVNDPDFKQVRSQVRREPDAFGDWKTSSSDLEPDWYRDFSKAGAEKFEWYGHAKKNSIG